MKKQDIKNDKNKDETVENLLKKISEAKTQEELNIIKKKINEIESMAFSGAFTKKEMID